MFHSTFARRRRAGYAVLGVLAAGGLMATAPVGSARAADPSSLVVTKQTDSGPGSLRAAIDAANADPTADEIVLGAGTYLLHQQGSGENDNASGDLDVLQALTIRGAGATETVIDASALGDRALHVIGEGRLTLIGVTIANAETLTNGGAVLNASPAVLTVTDSAFRNNRAAVHGGAISGIGPIAISGSVFTQNEAQGVGSHGAAIYFDVPGAGTFGTIERSAIVDNESGNVGGAIAGQGMHLTISNTTISANRAAHGSALWNLGGAIATRIWVLDHVTVANNFAMDGAAVHALGNAEFTLADSIIALNSGGTCNVNATTAAGLNLVTGSGCGSSPDHFINLAGDPGLRPLTTAGQLTPVHRLEAGSPAVNKTTCAEGDVDQRSVLRPTAAGACDIGAYERRLVAVPDHATFGPGQIAVNMNVVANDIGYDPGALDDLFTGGSFTIVSQPAHGTVTLGAGDATYQPSSADFSGLDTFVYEVCLAGECSTAEVTIEVLAVVASQFEPLAPTRILDTRQGGTKPAAGSTTTLHVLGQGGIPATEVTAVVLNITATQPDAPGYVTVSPTGQPRPVVSSLNVEFSGQSIPNLVTVPVGTDGSIDLFTDGGAHLIADVAGYYRPVTDSRGGRFQAVQPHRIMDTRTDGTALLAGGTRDLTVTGVGGVPTEASAVVLNVTATRSAAAGYVTVWPGGTPQPVASNLNMSRADQTIANLVIVPVGANGTVSLFSDNGTDLVVDVTGWFTSDTAGAEAHGLFVPVTPRRLLDTRPTNELAADSSIVVTAFDAGTNAGAVVLNVTATQSARGGFLTVWPAGNDRPLSSNLNVERADQTIPNAAIVGVGSAAGVAIYSDGGTHLAVDLAGYYVLGV
jgi:hypothetical protein